MITNPQNNDEKINVIERALTVALRWVMIERTDEDNGKDVNDHLDKMISQFSEAITNLKSLTMVVLTDEQWEEHATQKSLDIVESLYNILRERDAEIERLKQSLTKTVPHGIMEAKQPE